MKIEITDADLIAGTVKNSAAQRLVRAAAYLLLSTIGDMSEDETATPTAPPLAPVAKAPATGASNAGASAAANTSTTTQAPPTGSELASNAPPPPPPPNGDDDEGSTPPPPPPVNLGNVPPPPSAATAGGNAAPSSATTAGGAPGVASVELDDKGNMWDARIHQASKGKKKDGTWKLKKIFDSTPQKEAEFAALVEQVTRENAAKRTGSAPPVQLPTGSDSVPVPPQPGTVPAPPSGVPAPPVSAPVPVPPGNANSGGTGGPVGGSPYQALIDKIIALTKEGKITHTKVLEMCTHAGATSLQTLSASPHLIPLVDKNIDAAVLGLM